jgi:ribosome-binding factor A
MTRRVAKVAELLKQLLAGMIKANLAEDYGMVTIIDVDLTADLKNAVIYISCLEKQYQDEVLKQLAAKTKDFQHYLGRKLEMKYTPRLEFRLDRGLEKVNRVQEILENLK